MPPRAISASTRHTRSEGRERSAGRSGADSPVNAARSARSRSASVGGRSPEAVLTGEGLLLEQDHQVAALARDGGVGLGDVERDDLLERGGELVAGPGVVAAERVRGDVPLAREVGDLLL